MKEVGDKAIEGWAEVIRVDGEHSRAREVERKVESDRLRESFKNLAPLERIKALLIAHDDGRLRLSELMEDLRETVGDSNSNDTCDYCEREAVFYNSGDRTCDNVRCRNAARENNEWTLLGGEGLVYPGHPITVAFVITHVYDSYEGAVAPCPSGGGSCHAVGNHDVPGAGSNVYLAVDLLKHYFVDGWSIEKCFEWADTAWGHVDGMAETKDPRWAERYMKGLAQAARVKERLAARLREWPRTAPLKPEPSAPVQSAKLSRKSPKSAATQKTSSRR